MDFKQFELLVVQSACQSYLKGCLTFVTSEHPYLNARSSEVTDA